ncbi:PREDICTED: toll-like receptor 13 [Cyprinodon variegatus]|uniref:toll-like receptor 13 n=1 Tax=Cyprinodon variegatus TaxID=28743 RepID=UPI0007424E37|nr:PREDICTED: toll-like receptor 13 [Cyprinodon variegatus]
MTINHIKLSMANSESSHILLLLLLFLACFNSSLPYVLKNCTILYQENPSADICLDCAKRKIETVPKDIPKDVVSLKLNNNWLQKINKDDFLGMSKLRTLDLTVNQITDVDQGSFIDLIFLKTLRMGNNKLNYLINNMFQGLSNLTVLLLNNNGIQFIDSRAFQSLINLETLDIGNNRLQQITDIQPILQLPRIRTLGLKCSGFSSFNTRDLQLGLPSNLKELDISGDYLKVFSLTKPIFPYLHRVEFTMCLYYKDLQWDIPEKELLKNISHLYLERPILSDEGITKVLESLDSLRHLRLNALKMRVYEGLLFTVCKIPTLRKLDLFNSNINNLAVQISLCSQLTELDMRKSDIGELPLGSLQSMKQLQSLNMSGNQLIKVPDDIKNLSFLKILNLNYNYILDLTCYDFWNTSLLAELYLKNNRISYVVGCALENLENLKILDLSFNSLTTFDNDLVLPNLEVLKINRNEIGFLKMIDFIDFQSLKELDVATCFWEMLTQKAFDKLNNVENITISHDIFELKHLEKLTIRLNPHESLNRLQSTSSRDIIYLESMKSLTMICNFFFSALDMKEVLWTMRYLENFTAVRFTSQVSGTDIFQFNPHLKSVAFTEGNLSDLDAEIFLPIPNLQSLDLSASNISSLDFLMQANLSALKYLKLTENKLLWINETVFKDFPSLTYLDLDKNPFTCDCSNAGFIQWVKNNKQTQVVNAHRYKCSFPSDKQGSLLLEFDIHSCRDDGSFFCFISSSCLVVLTLLTCFIYNFLRWHLTYTFHLFLAYLYDSRREKKGGPRRFDAFVSYNVHDENWVYKEMLPVLEGEQGWRLCLHHRDFQPGKPIIENITDAIYSSRKTICVISQNYLQSEWCSREIQMASYRLFDEKKDVLILLFLEDIPSRYLSPCYHIRKLVKKHTYLSWPQAAQHPEVFWQNVQRALKTGDTPTENTDLLNGPRQC